MQERPLSIGRAIIPRGIDDGAGIRLGILFPAFATRVGGVVGFVASVVAWIPSASANGILGRRTDICNTRSPLYRPTFCRC